MTKRKDVAVRNLIVFAKANNIKAIEALIKAGIDPDYYLDQLCEMVEAGSTNNEKLKEVNFAEIEMDERVKAATKIISLDKEKDLNIVKDEDLVLIKELMGAGLEED